LRVALVITEIGRSVGGRFTFQEMITAAVERLRGETRHEFVSFSSGISSHTEGSRAWRARRKATVAATLAIQASRDVQDKLVGKRLIHVRTALQRRLDAAGIDVVWFPTTYAEDVDLPYLATVFDLEHRQKPWFPEVSVRGEFERRERMFIRYLPKATRVIVPNTTGRDQVVRYYNVTPENCLPLGHPTPDFALAAAARPPRSREEVSALGIESAYVLYPAQFWPHKNHAAALDALAELRRRGEDLSLVLVGSDQGQQEHVRQQARERDLETVVHVLGYVRDDDLVALYQHARALLYLSRFGPENLPPLEALALGCPAIVEDVPGAREQFGGAALVVDARDPRTVADAVVRTADEAERARLVAAGTERARAWTADDYVRGVIGFLDEFEQERRLWT
jgi:glycosyltransferase involved in cell wall biosynthesis